MLKFFTSLPLLVIASNEFGKTFLEENKGKDGVIALASGLQYKVLRAGTGSDHPTPDSKCACHYEGRIAEYYPAGEKFDSSYDRGKPSMFAPKQVIKGWQIAMQLMVEGDKWEMYIPSELAYGDRGRPPEIPGGAVLVFTMEIVKIMGNRRPAEKKGAVVTKPSDEKPKVEPPLRVVFEVAKLEGEPSEGSFTLEVHPDWAPLGARRLQELVEAKFFDSVRFFRVIKNFMAQFGIHGDPSVMHEWDGKKIDDDERNPSIGNKRGRVSFAKAGPNTRSTQCFINFKDNDFLDDMGFTPVAEVVDGMDVVDRIFKVGEGAPKGPGPNQGKVKSGGNAYLDENFPELTYIKSCRAVVSSESNKVQSAGSESTTKAPEQMVQDFGDGLKFTVAHAGDGKTYPHKGDRLTMHYTLTLVGDTSGKVIDSSRSRKQPFTFTIGRGEVISGWDKGVMQMTLGERGTLIVPSDLGYGAKGSGSRIPPSADLSFDVEVLGISGQFSAAGKEVASDDDDLPGVGWLGVFAVLLMGIVWLMLCRRMGMFKDLADGEESKDSV